MAFRDKDFDPAPSGNLTSKISTQIDGQLPDFIQADHPVFSRFLKHYYQYLEAGELRITSNIDNLLLELETKSFALDVDGDKIVLEKGAGSDGKFAAGETITGGTSNATATVLVDDLGNSTKPRLFITSQQKFITGETITGGTSGATGTVVRYRANPVQNIQQLLAYADTDNTIYDFLDNFRDEFMNAIPNRLADGLSKRKLIKNIRELYRAKGTSEGHKIFMRMLLGETADVIYPNKFMMRASDGKWGNKIIMRAAPLTDIDVLEAVGTTILGKTSGATAIIASATSFSEGGAAIVEFELNADSISSKFTFTEGETLTTTSTVQDIPITFTLKNIVATGIVTNRSALYTEDQEIEFDANTSIGNGLATARIQNIIPGSVSDIVIDDAGTKYEVGDPLTFTTTDTDTITASGFVSVIDGSIALDGTDAKSTDEGDFLISESDTINHIELFSVEMERGTTGLNGESLILDNVYESTVIQVESGVASTGSIVLDGSDYNKIIHPHNVSFILEQSSAGTEFVNEKIRLEIGIGTDENDPAGFLLEETDGDNIVGENESDSFGDNIILEGNKPDSDPDDPAPPPIVLARTPDDFYVGDILLEKEEFVSYDIDAYNDAARLGPNEVEKRNIKLWEPKEVGEKLELESYHDVADSHAGHDMAMEWSINQTSKDTYGSDSDRFAIEETTDYSGAISKIFVKDGGVGYRIIPSVAVSTTTTGTGSALLAVTNNIGAVGDIEITNQGFNYNTAPFMDFRANFTLKDVSGTFEAANTLTTHTGVVKGWDSTNNVLTTTFEDVVRSTLEISDNEGIALEDNLRDGSDVKVTTIGINRSIDEEDNIVDADGNRIVLDADEWQHGYITLEEAFAGGPDWDGPPISLPPWASNTAGSALILESPNDSFFPPLQLEYAARDGTNVGDGITNEDGTGDVLLSETAVSLGGNGEDRQLERIVLEETLQRNVVTIGGQQIGLSPQRPIRPDLHYVKKLENRLSGAGTYLITDSSEDIEPSTIILNATDSSQTDAGGDLLNEEHGDNNTIILEGTDSDFIRILLDGTDGASSNAEGFIHVETGIAASGVILTEDSGTTIQNEKAKLLQNIEPADGVIALNGTNSDSTNGGDSVISESGIDFFDGATGIAKYPTTITDSSGATGTIVKANIAKGTSTIDVTMETLKSYSTNIESLIGEDLNRIQDSYYYQQFSYEVQSGFGVNSYLNQLKKAVHPAGWAAFGKVKVASSISAAVQAAGSSLGGGWFSDLGVAAPADQFSPILASTFEILFDEVTQRRLGVVDIVDGAFDEHVVLEESEDLKVEGDSIILDGTEVFEVAIEHGGTDGAGTNAGDNIVLDGTDSDSTNATDQIIVEGYSNAGSYVIEETPIFHFDDFTGVQLEDGVDTDAGGYGVITLNGTDSSSTNANDRIISEKSVVISANLVMNSSEDSDHVTRTDAGDDILLDGTDSDSTNAGDSMELEDASAGIVFNRVGLQGNQVLNTLLNEDGGSQQLETSMKGGGPNHDVSLVTFISRKIHIPQSTPRHLSTGLVTFGRNPFPNQVSRFELEKGTANPAGYLLVDNDIFQAGLPTTTGVGPDEVQRADYAIDAGESFILEDAADPNNDSSFTFENIGNYSNDNIVAEFDVIILETATTGWTGTSSDKIILNATDSDYTDAGENIVAEVSANVGDTFVLNGIDSSSTSAGYKILGESVVQYDFFTMSDFIRPSLLVIDSHLVDGLGPTGGSTPVSNTAIILEESSESGFFMQENGTTASGAHGDNILLESKTGFGTNNKLELESDRIIVENYLNSGTIPFQNYTNSTLQPIVRPSDILISEYGALDLEDETDGSLLLNGTDSSSTDAGGRFRFELATDDNININYPNV